jgi:hypothetical protein
MSSVAVKARTVPLSACPDDLPVGAEVVIARPLYPSPSNPPGRRGVVASTSLHAPEPRNGRDGKPGPRLPPRLAVWVRVTDRPAYPNQQAFKWASELDLIVREGGAP